MEKPAFVPLLPAPEFTATRPEQRPAPAANDPRLGDRDDALPAGTRLHEFELLRTLGAGGFGIVYLAVDHALLRQVAIKEYMPCDYARRTDSGEIVARSAAHAESFAIGMQSFVKEAQLLASFNHASLVKVLRFWEANGTAYMAMQYYPGRTLKEERRAMTAHPDETWLRRLVNPLLGALEVLHAEGVFHRDISPDNILLLPDGSPVLLDFGAARRVLGDRTQALTALFKPNFAPIEQYGDVPGMRQGAWTDLYALGGVIQFMLTGKAPLPAALRTVHDHMPALSAPDAPFRGLSPSLLRAFDWALEVHPQQRPQTAEALRDALDGIGAPPTLTPRLPPPPPDAGGADVDAEKQRNPPAIGSAQGAREVVAARAPGAGESTREDAGSERIERADRIGRKDRTARAPTPPRRRYLLALAVIVLVGFGTSGLALRHIGDHGRSAIAAEAAALPPETGRPAAAPKTVATTEVVASRAPTITSTTETSPVLPARTAPMAGIASTGIPKTAAVPDGAPSGGTKTKTADAMPAKDRGAGAPRAQSKAPSLDASLASAHTTTAIRAPAQEAGEPTSLPRAATASGTPKAACGDRSFLSMAVCMTRVCQEPRFQHDTQCIEYRHYAEARQQAERNR